MKKIIKLVIISIIITILLAMQLPTMVLASKVNDILSKSKQNNEKETEYKDREVIVMYDKNNFTKKSNSLLSDLKIKETVEFTDAKVRKSSNIKQKVNEDIAVSLVSSDKYSTDELIERLKKDKRIMYVSKNYKVKASNITNEPYEKYQWAIENNGQNAGYDGNDIKTRKSSDTKEKVIAIVDTGVDYEHTDLKDVMWKNPYSSKVLKGEHGFNTVTNSDDPMDDNGHGTHCAGIIASNAKNNTGTTGAVLGADNVKIMALKFLGEDGRGESFDAIEAYQYIYRAQQLGTNVIAVNNSWGGEADENDEVLNEVINLVGEKGALSICSAGNEGVDTDKNFNSPSCLESDYIVSVAASNEKDELATFSNFGEYTVDIAAPGTNILSTVSSNVFNPSIYTEEQLKKLCSEFHTFNNDDIGLQYKTNGGEVSISKDEYFGKKGTSSLEWQIKNVELEKVYSLAIPINVENENQFYSLMLKVSSGLDGWGLYDFGYYADATLDEIDFDDIFLDPMFNPYASNQNYWEHYYEQMEGTNGVILLSFMPFEEGTYNFYIDDFAISSPESSEEDFGKYDFYNGTSMAAPYVTAAVATISNLNKGETVLQTKSRLLGAAREINFDDIESDEKLGTLDLTDLENVAPEITSVNMEANGVITVKGDFFGNKPILYLDGNKVNSKYSNGVITYTNIDLKNKYAEFQVENEKGKSYGFAQFLKVGNKLFNNEKYDVEDLTNIMTTDGEDIYGVRYNSKNIPEIIKIDISNGSTSVIVNSSDISNIFENYNGKTDILFESIAYADNKIWIVASLNLSYYEERIFLSYDLSEKDAKIEKVGEIPQYIPEYGYTLTSYNSNIYFIGGLEETDDTHKYLKDVNIYNTEKNKWEKGVELPEGIYSAKACQVGNKLVVMFGENDSDEEQYANTLIFDGKQWKQSNSYDFIKNNIYYNFENYIYISAVKDGVLISGVQNKEFGEIIKYNVVTDKYETIDYLIRKDTEYVVINTLSVKDKLYAIIRNFKNAKTEIKSMPITSGMPKVNVTIKNNGAILTDNRGTEINGSKSYLPGTNLELKLKVKDGYKLNSFKVNNNQVKGDTFKEYLTADMNVEIDTQKIQSPTSTVDTMDKASVTGIKDKTYTGQPLVQQITVKYGDKTLREGIDYVLRYTNNNNPGKATLTITGIGNYSGTIIRTFNIVPKKVSGVKNSSANTTSLKLTWDKQPKITNYLVYKYNSSSKKYENIGKTNKNYFTVKGLKAASTYKFKIRAYVTIDKNNKYGTYSDILTTGTSTVTPKITKLSAAKKSLTAKWGKISGASGYEVYIATSKNGKYTKKKIIKSGKTISAKITGLKSKKNYYVKIRTYRTVNGKNIYSSFSSVKSIKVK